jgi:CRISPR-associated protein Cmr1
VIKKLLNAENSLWGGNTTNDQGQDQSIKSPVSIAILNQQVIEFDHIQANKKGNALGVNCIPNYVLFPVTENVVKNNEKISVIKKLSFELLISYPESRKVEVLNTLKLWMLFGGVGGRTRRGTGSLYCADLMQGLGSKDDIKDLLVQVSGDSLTQEPGQYARLAGGQLFLGDKDWTDLITNYGAYRQDRRPGNPRPGRSYWPEPDAIRRITNQNSSDHEPVHPDKEWFPRAAFGLPILTRFNTSGDPGGRDTIHLEPDMDYIRGPINSSGSARFPSPMILKTIRLATGETISCCLVLNQQFPERLKLKAGRNEYPIKGSMLPFTPDGQKTMRTKDPLAIDESIYQNLASYLKLEQML